MSFSIGDVDAWSCMSCHMWSSSDVYVFRVFVQGIVLHGAEDLLPFIEAFGNVNNLRLDVRGAGFWIDPARITNGFYVDIVSTLAEGGIALPFVADDASSIAKKITAYLGSTFPSMTLVDPIFGPIAKPNDAIDHWLALPVMFDHSGVPTASFAKPIEYNLFSGKADDGAKTIPLLLGAPPGLGPFPGGKASGNPPGAVNDFTVGLLVALAALGVGWATLRGKKK